jgi:hypothetical protein
MVKFNALYRIIKNGKVITIREAKEEDAAKISECIKIFVHNNEGQVWEQGEFSPTEESH